MRARCPHETSSNSLDLILASRSKMLITSRPCRLPTSKSMQPCAVERDRRRADPSAAAGVHRAALERPIGGGAAAAQLGGGRAARFVLPFPHPLVDLRAAAGVLVELARGVLVADDGLGGEPG